METTTYDPYQLTEDNLMRKLLVLASASLLSACTGLPEGIKPVENFESDRYLGTWYEIARLDHTFERDMEQVTAEYSLRKDGGLRVINRGYDTDSQKWKEVEGKAYFVNSAEEGHLKVSFFGPFYGSYAIFDLDRDEYQYAFIAGNSTDYLWLLARTPSVSEKVLRQFESQSESLGFPTEELIYVDHE
jgi:apolipoprotein D and lipocalin family protein